jgi:hypothetical protein
MYRREFIKLSALIGGGLALSQFTFGGNVGYFKMKLPMEMIYWNDSKGGHAKIIVTQTYNVKSFENFISKNWSTDKSIFVYNVMNEPMNGMKYVRAVVLDIPHKSINAKMSFDRKFTPTNNTV